MRRTENEIKKIDEYINRNFNVPDTLQKILDDIDDFIWDMSLCHNPSQKDIKKLYKYRDELFEMMHSYFLSLDGPNPIVIILSERYYQIKTLIAEANGEIDFGATALLCIISCIDLDWQKNLVEIQQDKD